MNSSQSLLMPLQFITITLGQNTTAFNPLSVDPIYDFAFEKLVPQYPKLFENYSVIMRPSFVSSCTDDGREQVLNTLADLYQERSFIMGQTIIFAPQMDVLVATSAAADTAYADKTRFPTVLSFSYGDMTVYGMTILHLLRHFKWRTLAIIVDKLSGNDYATKNLEMCRGTQSVMQKAIYEVNALEFTMDSTTASWERTLHNASLHSRIMLCCTLTRPLRDLLATAADLRMDGGDYVFLSLYILQVPYQPPLRWQNADDLDKKVKRILSSLFVIRSPPVDWIKMRNLTHDIIQKRYLRTQVPVAPELAYNEIFVVGTEMVEVIAKVMESHRLSRTRQDRMTGTDLAKMFYNRTFHVSLTNTTVSMDHRGNRWAYPEVQQFHDSFQDFRTVFWFNPASAVLISGGSDIVWNQGFVPLDRADCMHSDRCPATVASVRTTAIGVSVTTIGIVMAIVACLVRHRHQDDLAWWRIKRRHLKMTDLSMQLFIESCFVR
ncbi:hypothetical protein BV898_09810 [Hypsibius exemplaris]|uniref:Receptor ligand binding region domain-containing protein n=1 Tax=Hypsibius exemplaris TaxID=2072580 RepID=A0A1W0WLF2_HYPEX|nr:hypothetical protein BV898_09810 [Hypsibius exemplaris]